MRIIKFVTYHSSTGVPAEELADRCHRTLDRAVDDGADTILAEQREWLDAVLGRPATSSSAATTPASRRCAGTCSSSPRRSAQTQEHGIAAKGVTGGGYEGHYFWDTEMYVVPFLAYTNPEAARKAAALPLAHAADTARQRAGELNQVGALYPWRTINGEEASAYYAAGTAQYHINAAIAFALKRYLDASGDVDFLADEGAEILVETARLWDDLGFYATNGERGVPHPRRHRPRRVHDRRQRQPVHERDGPLQPALRGPGRRAARGVGPRRVRQPVPPRRARRRTSSKRWTRAADAMYLPVRRGARHPPAGRRRSSSSSRGTSRARRPTSTRCCCTSTRS